MIDGDEREKRVVRSCGSQFRERVIGMVLLAPGVRRDLNEYWRLYKSGVFDRPAYATPKDQTA